MMFLNFNEQNAGQTICSTDITENLLLIILLSTYEQKGYPPKILLLLHIILFYAISDKHQTVTFLKRSKWSDIDNPFYDKNKGRYKAKKTGIYIVYFHVGLEVKSATQITGVFFLPEKEHMLLSLSSYVYVSLTLLSTTLLVIWWQSVLLMVD